MSPLDTDATMPTAPAPRLGLAPVALQLCLTLVSSSALSDEPAGATPATEVLAPTPREVRTALEQHIGDINLRSGRYLGEAKAPAARLTLDGLLVHRCDQVPDDPASFDCQMDLRLRRAAERPVTQLVRIRLTREAGRWLVN